MLNTRGQASIVSIVYLAVSVIVLAALTPQIIYYTEYAQNATADYALTQMIVGLIPFFLWLVVIISAIKVTTPYREKIFGTE